MLYDCLLLKYVSWAIETSIEKKVLTSSSIMEAIDNVKATRNYNSFVMRYLYNYIL